VEELHAAGEASTARVSELEAERNSLIRDLAQAPGPAPPQPPTAHCRAARCSAGWLRHLGGARRRRSRRRSGRRRRRRRSWHTRGGARTRRRCRRGRRGRRWASCGGGIARYRAGRTRRARRRPPRSAGRRRRAPARRRARRQSERRARRPRRLQTASPTSKTRLLPAARRCRLGCRALGRVPLLLWLTRALGILNVIFFKKREVRRSVGMAQVTGAVGVGRTGSVAGAGHRRAAGAP